MAGRPRERTFIVEDGEILPPAEIRQEKWRLSTLGEVLSNTEQCMMWLARRRLLGNRYNCVHCNVPCTLVSYQQRLDGKRWICSPCKTSKSIREGSFFCKSHLQLKQIIRIVYCWAYGMTRAYTKHEAEVTQDHTIVDWFHFCRSVRHS
jgi:hypothetical protein